MTGRVYATAAAGFARAGADYERGRPGYPPAAISHLTQTLGIARGARVLDLAAGTGKLTRAVLDSGATLTAVEPVAGMREQLERTTPGVRILEGTAERIPLPDGELDAVAAVVAHDPETAGRQQIAMPYTTHVASCHGRAAAN